MLCQQWKNTHSQKLHMAGGGWRIELIFSVAINKTRDALLTEDILILNKLLIKRVQRISTEVWRYFFRAIFLAQELIFKN